MTLRLLAVLACCTLLLGAEETAQTGFFTTTFAERHPNSAFTELGKRYGWTNKPAERDLYDIAAESFDVFVPKSYTGTTAFGLIVYTNSGAGGNNKQYSDLMEKHRLIWLGASNVPNERAIAARWGLALDAAWNMAKKYRIDPKRVYAVGNSGGGRCSSMLAPTWPETFSGGIYLVGCNRPIMPTDKALAAKALTGRYALMTGSGDFNRKDTQGVHAAYKDLKFTNVEYFEEPGLDHKNPSPEWFEKALVFVDAPLIREATAQIEKAQALVKAKKTYEAAVTLQGVIRDYPVAEAQIATATTELAGLLPQVEALLAAEMTALGAGTKQKWRAMTERTRGFAGFDQAMQTADALGQKELAPLLDGKSPQKLAKFAAEWAGYPCASQAEAAYDQLASAALEPLRAQPADKRTKPLTKYLKDWQDCPSRRAANDLLEADLDAQLTALLALEKGRDNKLIAFAKQWQGTAAGAKAIAALTPPEKATEKKP